MTIPERPNIEHIAFEQVSVSAADQQFIETLRFVQMEIEKVCIVPWLMHTQKRDMTAAEGPAA